MLWPNEECGFYSREGDKDEQITAETHQVVNTRPLLDEYYMKLLYFSCTFLPSWESVFQSL